MYDPSMRVLTVLELLQAHEEVSGADLARRLEVSPRTVQRYVARLQDLGIPVEGRRGVGGAYRLKPGFRLPPLMFTPEEALAAALGLRTLRHLGLHALAPAAEAATAKLTRSLPEALRADVQALEDSLQMEPSPWVVRTDAPLLAALLRAVRDTRRVAFRYAAPDSPPTARQADVYRVVHLDGRWYAAAHCHLRGALRSFRLDRMSGLEICAQTFTPPADFDAGAFLRATHAPAAFDVSVWLDCPPGDLRGRVSAWGAELRAEGRGTRLSTRRESLGAFAAFLLGLDCPFRVDSPPQLQDEFRRLAGRCAAQLAYTGA
ncbi:MULTISPECIES: YafY family protein [unclassified Deinococcus]|uniref:helix-turn-helix transcriptional regulator n=1 Tax=unclassified Deinococcus TaxID=2623546 RepID=UPI001E475A52|nr:MULTISPECIES: YafY family protein [unclassified Deinococcus]MCD0162706.1 YafY family transcriptional regulator [Deinococcus sp. 6YEL10]MCD0170357.1 YafY family transcriptional regulator [Deinococcus sp. 23YEL01]